jgi:hypothetical protein
MQRAVDASQSAKLPKLEASRAAGLPGVDAMYTRYTVVARTDLDEDAAKMQAMLDADRQRAALSRKTASERLRSSGLVAAEAGDGVE